MTELEWYDDDRAGADFGSWRVKVYRAGDKFVVADQSGWLPGEFDTAEEAVEAARQVKER